jgi:hypothetical protein
MSMSLLEHSNYLIDENRRRIERFRSEIQADAAIDSNLRQRVLQQMELSLQSLVRHRDALASRVAGDDLGKLGA